MDQATATAILEEFQKLNLTLKDIKVSLDKLARSQETIASRTPGPHSKVKK